MCPKENRMSCFGIQMTYQLKKQHFKVNNFKLKFWIKQGSD